MRLSCLLAVLSAVLSAGAAHACCFFHFFKHSAPGVAAPAAPQIRVTATGDDTGKTYMKITWIGGLKVDELTGTIAKAIEPRPFVEVIVETDAWTGTWCDVNLLEPTGSLTGAAPVAPAAPAVAAPAGAAKKPRVVFKEKRPKNAMAAAAPAAPGGAAGVGVAGAYEFVFWVYDLDYGYTYKTYAYSNWCWASSAVAYFSTRSVESPPGPPHSAAPQKK